VARRVVRLSSGKSNEVEVIPAIPPASIRCSTRPPAVPPSSSGIPIPALANTPLNRAK
jgi:hypothetical protein